MFHLKEVSIDLWGERRGIAANMAGRNVGLIRGEKSSVELVKSKVNRGEVSEGGFN